MSVDPAILREAKVTGQTIAELIVGDRGGLTLRPAYPRDSSRREHDIRAFSRLRAIHADSFFDTARPSEAEVRHWVERSYDADDTQINFVVSDEAGEILLFLGLSGIDPDTGTAEFGRLMRSEGAPRGLAAAALPALFAWAGTTGLERIDLEVFADNEPAKRLYDRVGFIFDHEFRRTPVRDGERIRWHRASGPGDRAVVAMRLDLTRAGANADREGKA